MAFEQVTSLDSDVTVNIGGFNKKSGKPNPTSIEGFYLGAKTGIPNKFNPEKPDTLHILQTPKGNVGVWGKSHLNPQMTKVILGCMVRISANGTRPSNKGNDQLLFKVEQDKNNCIDVSDIASDSEQYDASDESNAYDVDATFEQEPAPYTPPIAAKAPAKAPDPARAAKVAAILNGGRNKTA